MHPSSTDRPAPGYLRSWSRVYQRGSLLAGRVRMRLSGKPGVGYVGYLGGGNLGDDLMPDVVRGILPGISVQPLGSGRRERQLARLGLGGRGLMRSVLLGGGTLINPVVDRLEQVRAAQEQGLPVWCLGTGVGSCGFDMESEVSLNDWIPLLRRFARIGVRGPLSRDALHHAGVAGVEVVGDLALALTRRWPAQPTDPPLFAVNLTQPHPERYGRGEYPRLQELEQVVRERMTAGWHPVLLALHASDARCLQLLRAQVGAAELPIHQPRSAGEFLELMRPCRFSVGVRLHASVLSCCAGVPPLILGYREKCRDFALSMQLEDWYLSLDHARPGEILDRAAELSTRCAALREPVLSRALHWRERILDYVAGAVRLGLVGGPAESPD